MCAVNFVRFVTINREKGKKTQNSGVSTGGDHDKVDTQFYGVLKKIKELTYNSDEKHKQTVVCFLVTGIVLNMKVTAGLSCKSMMDTSEASMFPVYGTRMISISCQPRQKNCSMWHTELGEKIGG